MEQTPKHVLFSCSFRNNEEPFSWDPITGEFDYSNTTSNDTKLIHGRILNHYLNIYGFDNANVKRLYSFISKNYPLKGIRTNPKKIISSITDIETKLQKLAFNLLSKGKYTT